MEHRPSAALVWGTWAAMLAAALLLVAHYGSNVPSWDDWDMVPVLTRMQPVTADWLWSQHNEHRVPLPRLLFLALNRLTLVDFRVTMFFDVLVMGALAAAAILIARRLRGHTSVTDAFFPLIFLHWGHAVNLLWGWQLEFFASAALACTALFAIVQSGTAVDPRRAGIITGACAGLLPLCGANGLGLAPALALWPLGLALLPSRWTGTETARGSRLLIGLGAAALVLSAAYFVGWQPVPYHPKSHSVAQSMTTALQFATIGLGPATRRVWPFSGLGVMALGGLTAWWLLRLWRDQPAERARAGGLLLVLGALASLALGLGLGRNGFEVRYVALALPAWCCAYFVWDLYGTPPLGRTIRGLFGLAAVAALPSNTRFGLAYARDLRTHLGGFERDMASGVPIHDLVRRYDPYLHPHQDVPTEYLPLLRRAGVGRYTALRDNPPLRAVSVPLVPGGLSGVQWGDSIGHVFGRDPWIDFALPENRYATGIRLRYRYRSDDGTLPFIGLRWKRREEPDFAPDHYKKYSPTGDRANWEQGTWTRLRDPETTMTVWVSDTIGQIRITPNYVPGVFRITELVLLVPAE